MSGSFYGIGAYGQGRYSRLGQEDGALVVAEPSYAIFGGEALPIEEAAQFIERATRARFGGQAMRSRGAAITVSPSLARFRGTKMWDEIPAEECTLWPVLSWRASRGQALPNSFGSAFPGAAS